MPENAVAETPTPVSPLPAVVQRYLDGEPVSALAHDFRVSMQTIYNWMHAETGPEYKTLKRKVFINRLADADYLMLTAPSQLELARARELSRNVRWDLERAFPEQFGPKQQVQTDNKITVIVQRERPQPVVVEAQAVSDAVQLIDNMSGRTPNPGV